MSDVQISSGSVFCVACANPLVQTAAFCPKCGTPRAYLPSQEPNTGARQKSKNVAVVLAVFLSYWSWLYSYKKDAAKFYVCLGLSILLGFTNLLIINGLVFSSYIPLADQYEYIIFTAIPEDPFLSTYFFMTYLVSVGFWIWAIVSAAKKPSRF
jgi:hypothetical protein